MIDTETAGFDARGQDRIAEIAIVTVAGTGEILDRWKTLIDPRRDLGKTSLHGIRAAETLDAPLFADLAEEVAWRLSGTVPVAHNLDFDARFLDAELDRAGISPPTSFRESGLCTMRMAHEFLPGAGRRLGGAPPRRRTVGLARRRADSTARTGPARPAGRVRTFPREGAPPSPGVHRTVGTRAVPGPARPGSPRPPPVPPRDVGTGRPRRRAGDLTDHSRRTPQHVLRAARRRGLGRRRGDRRRMGGRPDHRSTSRRARTSGVRCPRAS
ncbi:3'-5' exonuclease [Nesterenkonia sp. F]|uniref:3'-5' exonuclease n=1 Tax=Nesterenkonia sp. F TaxID=795955 RepID=UPI000255CD2D|nr:3'-5' exonuclease [Nesterenkonia sp. F]